MLSQVLACFKQAVEFAPFAENGGFGRVEVFWFFVAQHAPAKADVLAFDVANGEHDAVAEAVVARFAAALLWALFLALFWVFGGVGVLAVAAGSGFVAVVDDQAAFFEQGAGVVGEYGA